MATPFNNINGFSINDFIDGKTTFCAQSVLGVAGGHQRTKDISLEKWLSGYNLSITLLNYGANPLAVCTFYGGFNSIVGAKLTAASIDTSFSNMNNFFNHNVDPATLAAGASALCIYNQDVLPDSIRVGLTAVGGAATNVALYFKVTKK